MTDGIPAHLPIVRIDASLLTEANFRRYTSLKMLKILPRDFASTKEIIVIYKPWFYLKTLLTSREQTPDVIPDFRVLTLITPLVRP